MFDEIRSVLQQPALAVAGGAEKLRNVLSLTDASTKLLLLFLMMLGVARGFAGRYLGALLCILCRLGMCIIGENRLHDNGPTRAVPAPGAVLPLSSRGQWH
jgi:hypothetical protein